MSQIPNACNLSLSRRTQIEIEPPSRLTTSILSVAVHLLPTSGEEVDSYFRPALLLSDTCSTRLSGRRSPLTPPSLPSTRGHTLLPLLSHYPLVVMSMPLQVRRSARHPEPRRLLAQEQALHRQQELEDQELQRALRAFADTVEPSDDSEHELADDDGDSSEDERKVRSDRENIVPWSQQLHNVHPPLCDVVPVVTLPAHRVRTELGYLQCFIDPHMIKTFVDNTNQYATDRRAVKWDPVNTEEMWRYLAVRIRQGIVVLPDMHMYWQDGYRDAYITQLMDRDRFLQLHRYFHIAPPVPVGDRQTVVKKTDAFYHQCQRLFKAYHTPGREFAVDETMIRFQGRSDWITVIKGKPTPIGYKLYTVASNGYMLDFRIFRGRGGYAQGQNALHHVVIDLVTHWAGANRWLFFDNLYTSPTLCDHLLRLKIRSCGTCRPNRKGLPDNIGEMMRSVAKGEIKSMQRGQLGCLVWNDSRPVIFLSTQRRVDRLTPIPPTHGRPATTRPTVAVDYNKNKGHVDQVDQLRSYHVVERRGRRTWPALAWWLLDMCISNAYKLWSLDTNTATGLLHFREQLLKQIAAAYPSQHTRVQPTVPAAHYQPFVGHWPTVVRDKRDCAHCSRGRRRRLRTKYKCRVCGVHLHPAPCFGDYHDRLPIDNRTV